MSHQFRLGYRAAAVAVLCAAGLLAGLAPGRAHAAPPPLGEVRDGFLWVPDAPDVPDIAPKHGQWRRYSITPRGRSVCAPRVAVLGGSGLVARAAGATCRGAGGPVTLQRGNVDQRPKLILDFGREMSGRLKIRFTDTSTPAALHIAFSETLAQLTSNCDSLGNDEDGTLPQAVYPDGYHPTCPRVVPVLPHFGPGDPSDKVEATEQVWTDPVPRPGFRYVMIQLSPQTPKATVSIESIRVRYTPMPHLDTLDTDTVYKGHFLSSDNALNRFWYDGAYTAQVDTIAAGDGGVYYEGLGGLPDRQPIIVDGAKLDRYIWYGAASAPIGVGPLLYGNDAEPWRNSLAALGNRPSFDGWISACVPSPLGFLIGFYCRSNQAWTDATPWWVIGLGDYYQWTGDKAFVEEQYARAAGALDVVESCKLPSGVIGPCHGPIAYFWSDDSASTYINAVYYRALVTGATLANVLDKSADAAKFEQRAAELKDRINTVFWDAAKGAYRQSENYPNAYPQDANVLTALWNIASPEQATKALDHVKTHLWGPYGTRSGVGDPYAISEPGAPGLVTPWMMYFEAQARLDRGRTAEVRKLLDDSFGYLFLSYKAIAGAQGNTMEPPSTTGWQHITEDGGMYGGSQESSGAAVGVVGVSVFETTAYLGVAPAAPGFGSWTIKPHMENSGLTWAEGRVPTPKGSIDVAWALEGAASSPTSLRLEATTPSGTSGDVWVPLFGERRMISVNGRVVWNGSRYVSGSEAVAGARAEGGFVRLTGVKAEHVTAVWG